MMRSLHWISLFAIILALVMSGNVAQAAPVAQQGSGQICVLAFDDQDGNGVREADEPLLAGVSFTLANAAGVKGSYKSDGNSEPYCFGSLAAGAYTVQARGAGSLEVTTPGQWAI
ncbi:MAG TPA: SdrD B-like domain-containing protein, partial [Anaerolineae bacterium]|nr:SdrD B-like domain-containing protein [Anaerolineae bacterium]